MMQTLRYLFGMIKFPHTIFALPFALTGAVLAAGGLPSTRKIFWIILAMVGARTAAMTFNRMVDRNLDARNPRTANREMPRGKVTQRQAVVLLLVSILLFEASALFLNRLCLILSPLALLIILGYSFTKRFTRYSHLVLGLALGLAPVGAWIAVRGTVELPALVLGAAVLLWVAGFDILYAIQDMDFDTREGLHSIPRFLGVRRSLLAARALHIGTLCLLGLEYPLLGLGGYYAAGVLVAALLLLYEHSMVRENDLSRLNRAFFNMNGYLSVAVFGFTLLDLLV